MKKYLYAGSFCFVLTLCLCLALGLGGCSRHATESVYYATPGNAFATSGNAWATNGNASDGNAAGIPVTLTPTPMPVPDPTATPAVELTAPPMASETTPTPQATEEPTEQDPASEVLTTPEPTPLPQDTVEASLVPPGYTGEGKYNGLSAILGGICDHYSTRSDASVGAKYAAQLVDWYLESGESPTEVYMGVQGWLDRMGVYPEKQESYLSAVNLMAKLDSVYAIAVTLFGEEGEALLDAGSYVPANFPYAMTDIDAVFSLVYSALGEIKPQYVRLYRGDEFADIITAAAGTLTPETLNKALVDAGVLAGEVSVLHTVDKDGTLRLDFSDAFLAQLQELDKEREEELIRTLVNTVSENLGYESMIFTRKGEVLKTANNTYDKPLTAE